jgi:hypothetical protein
MIIVIVRADPHGVDFERRDNFMSHQSQLFRAQKTACDVGLIADYKHPEAGGAQSPDSFLDSRLEYELGNMPRTPGLSIAKNGPINHAVAIEEYRTARLHRLAIASSARPDGSRCSRDL